MLSSSLYYRFVWVHFQFQLLLSLTHSHIHLASLRYHWFSIGINESKYQFSIASLFISLIDSVFEFLVLQLVPFLFGRNLQWISQKMLTFSEVRLFLFKILISRKAYYAQDPYCSPRWGWISPTTNVIDFVVDFFPCWLHFLVLLLPFHFIFSFNRGSLVKPVLSSLLRHVQSQVGSPS